LNLDNIIKQCLQKEETAEKALYFAYAQMVYGICRRYARDDHQAKDYMQDSFEKIFRNLHKYDAAKGAFDGWVNRLVTNTVLSELRKPKRYIFQEEISADFFENDEMPPEEDLLALLEQELITSRALLEAIRQLPEDYRTVLNLAVFEGWKHREIATFLHIAESSSRTKLQRAKKRLRELLNYDGKVKLPF